MTDEKILNESCEAQAVPEEDLESVAGGGGPGYQTTNRSTYSSGDYPRYKIGDRVEVKYVPVRFPQNERWMPFIVTGVSSTKNGGTFCKEFTYTLKSVYDDSTVLTDVYESCIRWDK